MRDIVVVMRRELWEQRSFFAAALVAAAAVFVVPLFAQLITRWAAADIREVLADVMAIGFAWLAALFLGVGVVGRDLADGRLGFYMSRPLRLPSLWFGKLAAAVVVVLGCELLILLPAILTPRTKDSWRVFVGNNPLIVGALVGVPIALILIAHAVGIMWQSRSTWLLLDAGGFLVTGLLCWLTLDSLWRANAHGAALVLGVGVFLAAAASLVVAGTSGLVFGRAELRRHHGTFSLTLWSQLLVVSLAGICFSWWIRSPGIEDLREAEGVRGAPEGDWLVVTGEARNRFGYRPTLLVNSESGELRRLGAGRWWWEGPIVRFAGDGTRVVSLEPADGGVRQVVVFEVGEWKTKALRTSLFVDGSFDVTLSRRGDRCAIVDGKSFAVYGLPSGDLLAAARIPEDGRVLGALFVGQELVRVFLAGESGSEIDDTPGDLHIYELDMGANTMVETGRLSDAGRALEIQWHRTSGRALLRRYSRDGWIAALLEGPEARVVKRFGRRELGSEARLLADGRVVHGWSEGGRVWIEVMDGAGNELTKIELGQGYDVTLGGEVAAGRLVVAVRLEDDDGWSTPRSALEVDLHSGTLRPIGHDLVPVASWEFWEDARPVPSVGGASSKLLKSRRGRLVSWDPATSELTEFVKGRG